MSYEKPDHITFKLRTFTDDEIESMLDGGGNFRGMDLRHRDNILTSLRQGWWDPCTGETLGITSEGTLVNGQHRLSAAQIYQREAGEKLWFWCAMGVDEKSGRNMDQGKNRRLVDYLKHEGVKHPTLVGQITMAQARIAMMPRASTSTLVSLCNIGTSYSKEESSKLAPSTAFCMDQYRRFSKSINEWALIGDRLKGKVSRHGLLVTAGFQFAKTHDMEAKLFFDDLIAGASLKPGDPILTLRERLVSDLRSAGKDKLPGKHVLAYAIKAWVAWNEGRTITTLRWAPTGPKPEPFPDHRFQKHVEQS
jgi:hypothetical protein